LLSHSSCTAAEAQQGGDAPEISYLPPSRIKKVTLKVGPLPEDVQMEEVDELEEDDFVPVSTFFILFSFSHFLR
jgi:hypothetical protein